MKTPTWPTFLVVPQNRTKAFLWILLSLVFLLKDGTRRDDYLSINGESSRILIHNLFSGKLHDNTRISKGLPMPCLCCWLRLNPPSCNSKYVAMDPGGELYGNPKVRRLFRS
jgi:hypothetical protein